MHEQKTGTSQQSLPFSREDKLALVRAATSRHDERLTLADRRNLRDLLIEIEYLPDDPVSLELLAGRMLASKATVSRAVRTAGLLGIVAFEQVGSLRRYRVDWSAVATWSRGVSNCNERFTVKHGLQNETAENMAMESASAAGLQTCVATSPPAGVSARKLPHGLIEEGSTTTDHNSLNRTVHDHEGRTRPRSCDDFSRGAVGDPPAHISHALAGAQLRLADAIDRADGPKRKQQLADFIMGEVGDEKFDRSIAERLAGAVLEQGLKFKHVEALLTRYRRRLTAEAAKKFGPLDEPGAWFHVAAQNLCAEHGITWPKPKCK